VARCDLVVVRRRIIVLLLHYLLTYDITLSLLTVDQPAWKVILLGHRVLTDSISVPYDIN